jgi:hypothetical protein
MSHTTLRVIKDKHKMNVSCITARNNMWNRSDGHATCMQTYVRKYACTSTARHAIHLKFYISANALK